MWDDGDVVIVTEGKTDMGLIQTAAIQRNMKILFDALNADDFVRAWDINIFEDQQPPILCPSIKGQTFYRYEDKPRQNNDWRKGNKRGFKGAVYGGH